MKNLPKLLILNFLTIISVLLLSTSCNAVINQGSDYDASVHRISKNLKCLVCSGESVYDSNSDFAITMKQFIREELELGKLEKDILTDIVNSYGEEILLNPLFSSENLLLWSLPILFLCLGLSKIIRELSLKNNKYCDI